MALGTLADNPDCGLKIVPCGMNYFHAHKFRSRAVIEFGSPIEVPREIVDQYTRGERREAVGALLDIIYQSLVAVTVTSPDYDTLMVCLLTFSLPLPPLSLHHKLIIYHRLSKLHVVCIMSRAKNCRCLWLSSLTVVL